MMKIYINVAVINNVNEILNKILNEIHISQLYDACDSINIIVNGGVNILNFKRFDKYNIINEIMDISQCEFPTLNYLWTESFYSEVNFNILYLHTKGVTKPGLKNISDWVDYLIYFNITNWKDRLIELTEYDCTGVDLKGNASDINCPPQSWGYGKAPLHYSGNFWWSKSDHIKILPNPIDWIPYPNFLKWRVMAEMWVCQKADSKYKCAFQSNNNFYINRFSKEIYRIEK